MQVTPLLHLGRVQRHRLPHESAALEDGEAEAQRASRITHKDIHLTYPKLLYSVCTYSSGGGGRRIATLGDDSDDGDDEQQNYFAGGERR